MVGVRQVRVRSYVQWRATAHVSNDQQLPPQPTHTHTTTTNITTTTTPSYSISDKSMDEMKKVKEMELKKLHANTWMLLDYLTTWIPEYVRKDDEFVGGAVLI